MNQTKRFSTPIIIVRDLVTAVNFCAQRLAIAYIVCYNHYVKGGANWQQKLYLIGSFVGATDVGTFGWSSQMKQGIHQSKMTYQGTAQDVGQ